MIDLNTPGGSGAVINTLKTNVFWRLNHLFWMWQLEKVSHQDHTLTDQRCGSTGAFETLLPLMREILGFLWRFFFRYRPMILIGFLWNSGSLWLVETNTYLFQRKGTMTNSCFDLSCLLVPNDFLQNKCPVHNFFSPVFMHDYYALLFCPDKSTGVIVPFVSVRLMQWGKPVKKLIKPLAKGSVPSVPADNQWKHNKSECETFFQGSDFPTLYSKYNIVNWLHRANSLYCFLLLNCIK